MSDIKELKNKMIYIIKNSDVKYNPFPTASFFLGRYNPDENEIVVVENQNDDSFFSTSVHEYAHYLVDTIYNIIPNNEGIAYYIENAVSDFFNIPKVNEEEKLLRLQHELSPDIIRIANEVVTQIIHKLVTKRLAWLDDYTGCELKEVVENTIGVLLETKSGLSLESTSFIKN